MSHSDLITSQCNQRLITPPPSPPPTTETATQLLLLQLQQHFLPASILRHRYHIDDDENVKNNIDIEQPNIATTKVYSDHEINYYSSSYHKASDTKTTTAAASTTTRTDNSNTLITPNITTATIEYHDDTCCYQNEPIRDQITDITSDQHNHEQHLYHTL